MSQAMLDRTSAGPATEGPREPEGVTATVADPTGAIVVTVGQHGEMRNLTIDPSVYSTHSARDLAITIQDTHCRAIAEMRKELTRQFRQLCGVELDPADHGHNRLARLIDKLAARRLA